MVKSVALVNSISQSLLYHLHIFFISILFLYQYLNSVEKVVLEATVGVVVWREDSYQSFIRSEANSINIGESGCDSVNAAENARNPS